MVAECNVVDGTKRSKRFRYTWEVIIYNIHVRAFQDGLLMGSARYFRCLAGAYRSQPNGGEGATLCRVLKL